MVFNDIEMFKLKHEMSAFVEKRRPPVNVRSQVDLFYKIEEQSITIFEIRELFQQEGKVEIPIAKATFIIKDNKWKIYWQRADLKWHSYKPNKEVDSVKEFIKIVDEDSLCCFWG